MQYSNLSFFKNKQSLSALKRLTEAGVPIEKILENFTDSPEEMKKLLAIAEATYLLREKAVSFSQLGRIYDRTHNNFHVYYKELQEIYDKSPEKFFQLTKNNWDFFTDFISRHKTPKDFLFLYEKEPKKFKKLRGGFLD